MTAGLVTRTCMADGCDRQPVARNLCSTHYDRSRREGTLDQYPPMRDGYTDHPAYVTIHMRLRHLFGPASGYACVDCGEQARDWSFDDDTARPGTLWCTTTGRPYSADLDRYRPRCRRCHFTADGRRKYPPICGVNRCDADHKAYGFCGAHEKRRRRYGSPEFKWCTKAEVAALDLTREEP